MKLFTHFGNLGTATSVKDEVGNTMLSAVRNFESRVRKVNVSVRDINGPKGGKDIRCRCIVHLNRMTPIVVEETGENLYAVSNRVADRVAYALSQKIDRVNKSSRSRKTRERIETLREPVLVE